MIESHFNALATLYTDMDNTWNEIAAQYKFECNGCEDNCCKSLFFHHTFIERAYLRHGFTQLDPDTQKKIAAQAKSYCRKTFSQPAERVKSLKIMCPANENSLCLLYPYRPMICRLHGLPHELSRPGFKAVTSSGCDAGRFDDKPYVKFDRTPLYQRMAQLEMAFRQNFNKTGKIKETVAQILLT